MSEQCQQENGVIMPSANVPASQWMDDECLIMDANGLGSMKSLMLTTLAFAPLISDLPHPDLANVVPHCQHISVL